MISFVVLSKNNEKTIKKTLESTIGLGEVILIDTGSADSTLSIASKFPHVHVHNRPFTSFGNMRNLGAALASNPWIFALDSDEELSPALQSELAEIKLDKSCVYRVSSANYYRGKEIKHCGWSPDYKLRLYNKTTTSFTDRKVHETLLVKNMVVKTLRGKLFHYSYASAEDLLIKMHRYSTLFALEFAGKKKSSFLKAFIHGLWGFIKTYFVKFGFLDGRAGFIISKYNSQTAFYKYILLAEKNFQL